MSNQLLVIVCIALSIFIILNQQLLRRYERLNNRLQQGLVQALEQCGAKLE